MLPQLASGARGIVSYRTADGSVKVLGLALDISVNLAEGVQQTFVMGSYNAPGIDPISVDCTGSVSRVVPVNSSSSTQADQSQISAIDLGLQQQIQNVLSSQSVEVTVRDRVTDRVLGSIKEARFSGRSLSMGAQSLMTERLSFVGIWDGSYNNQQTAPLLGYLPSSA